MFSWRQVDCAPLRFTTLTKEHGPYYPGAFVVVLLQELRQNLQGCTASIFVVTWFS